MRREEYRNGDPISLNLTGCDGCNPAMINGHLCHEFGCTEAWRDTPVDCRECGICYYRTDRHQTFCDDCQHLDETWIPDPCPHCGSDDQDEISPDIYCGECGESVVAE